MNHIHSILLVATLLGSAASAGAATGSQKYKLDVGRFDKINVVENLNVVFRSNPDSIGMVAFRGNEKVANALLFSNNNGTLKIQIDNPEDESLDFPVIYVYSDFLTSATSSSEGIVRIEGNLAVPKFSAKLIGNGSLTITGINANTVDASLMTGNGTMVLQGKATKANFRVVGTGLINADALETETVKCNFMGGGTLGCWPIKTLDTRGIGTTRIYYKGTPQIKKVGGGKIYPLTSDSVTDQQMEE